MIFDPSSAHRRRYASAAYGLAYAAFYRTLGNWQSLSRNSADIVRTVQAGERWRADVRSATAPPRVVEFAQETIFHVPQAQGEILYAFRDGAVFRRARYRV